MVLLSVLSFLSLVEAESGMELTTSATPPMPAYPRNRLESPPWRKHPPKSHTRVTVLVSQYNSLFMVDLDEKLS
jgi:hypothetical protein